MKLSICIPVYNGSKSIKKLINKVKDELIKEGYSLEFVLVNDSVVMIAR